MSFAIKSWNGAPITESGIYADIPIRTYHKQLCAQPSISGSGLKTIFYDSLAHYFLNSYLNPERAPEKPNEALLFGRGAHHLLLGEHDFRSHFLIRPEEYPVDVTFGHPIPDGAEFKPWAGGSKWCKAWLADAAKREMDVLTTTDLTHIRGMAASLEAHPLIAQGILGGLIEHSFVWRHSTGVWLKWRPDAIPSDSLDFADLKTTADITDEGLGRAVGLGYQMQAGLGAMACRAVLGREMESFSLVFVEKVPPYACRVKTLKPADIDLGVKQVEAAVRLFARAVETGRWHPPGGEQTDAEFIDLPDWARKQAENRLALIQLELEQ